LVVNDVEARGFLDKGGGCRLELGHRQVRSWCGIFFTSAFAALPGIEGCGGQLGLMFRLRLELCDIMARLFE